MCELTPTKKEKKEEKKKEKKKDRRGMDCRANQRTREKSHHHLRGYYEVVGAGFSCGKQPAWSIDTLTLNKTTKITVQP